MAKPILIIELNLDVLQGSTPNPLTLSDVQHILSQRFDDYHVLCMPKSDPNELRDIVLQVFHEKDFTEVQYDELKKIIEDSLPKK